MSSADKDLNLEPITGAPGGHMLRSTVLHPIRWLNLLAGVTWLLWLALFVKSMVSVTRKG